MESESTTKSEYDPNPETTFWCNMLYFIGTHFIKVSQSVATGSSELNNLDPLSRICCGYWVLNMIGMIADQRNSEHHKEGEGNKRNGSSQL